MKKFDPEIRYTYGGQTDEVLAEAVQNLFYANGYQYHMIIFKDTVFTC